MKDTDYIFIKKIIDEEVEKGSIKDLLALKEYLLSSIDKKEEKVANVSDVMNILTMDLRTFLHGELDSIEFRSFKVGSIISAIRKIRNYDRQRPIYVLDLIGIRENRLLLQQGIGSKTISVIKSILSKYDLSLERDLTFDEKTLVYRNISSNKEKKTMSI